MSIRKYSICESVIFRKTKEEWGGLSNMASGYKLCVNHVIIPSAEHLYQSCRFPNNPEVQWNIINEPSPMNAKWVSRANTHLTRGDWEIVKYKIMKWVLELKLSQNWHSFGALLLRTGNKPIVEATNKDKAWGARKDGDYYIGINALGRLLMEVRELHVKPNQHNTCVHALDIPDFLFLDYPIETICFDRDTYEYEYNQQLKPTKLINKSTIGLF